MASSFSDRDDVCATQQNIPVAQQLLSIKHGDVGNPSQLGVLWRMTSRDLSCPYFRVTDKSGETKKTQTSQCEQEQKALR